MVTVRQMLCSLQNMALCLQWSEHPWWKLPMNGWIQMKLVPGAVDLIWLKVSRLLHQSGRPSGRILHLSFQRAGYRFNVNYILINQKLPLRCKCSRADVRKGYPELYAFKINRTRTLFCSKLKKGLTLRASASAIRSIGINIIIYPSNMAAKT